MNWDAFWDALRAIGLICLIAAPAGALLIAFLNWSVDNVWPMWAVLGVVLGVIALGFAVTMGLTE